MEEATDIQSCCKSWNFVPSLPDLSYFETMSSWQAQNQSLMETLSIVIGLLEGSYKSVEHSACQQEANDDSLFIPRSAATSSENDRIATSIGYRFHEGHNNAILKPVTIDMLTC